jgi:hypothetical protein
MPVRPEYANVAVRARARRAVVVNADHPRRKASKDEEEKAGR